MDIPRGRFQVICFHYPLPTPCCPIFYHIGELASVSCLSESKRLRMIYVRKKLHKRKSSQLAHQPDSIYSGQNTIVANNRYLGEQETRLSLCHSIFFIQPLRTSRTCIHTTMLLLPAVDPTAKNALNLFLPSVGFFLVCSASILLLASPSNPDGSHVI